MGLSTSNLTDAACAVHLFKINGYSATIATPDSLPSKRLAVGGYEWEIHYTPSLFTDGYHWIAFKLVLLGVPRRDNVKASLRCQLLYGSSNSKVTFRTGSFVKGQTSHAFERMGESCEWVPLCRKKDLEAPAAGIIANDSFTVECTVTVIADQVPAGTATTRALPQPYTGMQSLNHDLGELLGKGTGSDVTLSVAGESFAAHKALLASRSPVFMAEFFGSCQDLPMGLRPCNRDSWACAPSWASAHVSCECFSATCMGEAEE